MKNHKLFYETYGQIEDEKERLGFLRGYLFALTAKEMTRFMLENFEQGFGAYEQIFSGSDLQEKIAAKQELDNQLAFLKKQAAVPV